MSIPTDLKGKYRSRRNGWGWLLAIGWVAYWALQPGDDTIMGSLNHGAGVFFAVVTAPLAFVVSHYLASFYTQHEAGEEERAAATAARAAQDKADQERQLRLASSEATATAGRVALQRKEFIRKLGTASDALDILEAENDPKRMGIARQAVNGALRDLVASYTLPELSALLASDESAKFTLNTLLARMRTGGTLSADAKILENAQIKAAGAAANPVAIALPQS